MGAVDMDMWVPCFLGVPKIGDAKYSLQKYCVCRQHNGTYRVSPLVVSVGLTNQRFTVSVIYPTFLQFIT